MLLPDQSKGILIVNLQLADNISIICYLLVPERQDVVGALLHQFWDEEDDQWRDNHFKLLPHIAEGGFLIRKAVGTTPCLIGTKGTSTYCRVSKIVLKYKTHSPFLREHIQYPILNVILI